ncbi:MULTISPECIES: iron uptake system protein EfeO [Bacillaceae]|uniref:Iron ABC transporter substrate-binding protein n=1 Tax=Gottfriedia luciferensis TaxID=178774 RepID=A0ABX2ZUD6_9BACI|nr:MULTISPECIES: iron uptake system protein EfeO [Bacillaceae]ODG93383.1 iron ABC transporter substrate-binding protein [Gottfriedia luciferensis]PGZ88765.1 Efem/EfeO family lipoprotein [Bacillus sp. AFS029533]SFC48580.1 iron uptake system component EfeO [Bacillus sp. UNCCL81]
MKKQTTMIAISLATSLMMAGCAQKSEEASNVKKESKVEAKINLDSEINNYRDFVVSQTEEFVSNTQKFVDAINAGNMAEAKRLYPISRSYYERIEPVAESFGDLDPKIDAREGDVPANEWTGFHKIEQVLWVQNTTKGLEKYTEQLMKDANYLRAKVETAEIDPVLFVTGPVELLNEVSSSKVTGEEERYSHTDLADFAANVEGSDKIVQLLSEKLKAKDADLAKTIETRFNDLMTTLNTYKKGDQYVDYKQLKEDEVKKLAQQVDALAEPISQVGSTLGVK